MAELDIIITHYQEPWAECRKMFEGLRLQRGVPEGAFRVILVQDGPDGQLDLERIARVYPFVEIFTEIPHGGVSAARNEGLLIAESPWVMFCDCDDTFYTVNSLFDILCSIRDAGDRADLLYSDFWMEMKGRDGRYHKMLKDGGNKVFIHGKLFRREFLTKNGIRFDEELSYSEDALFVEEVRLRTDASRRAKILPVCYVWAFREESLSNYTGGDGTRMEMLYKKRLKTIALHERLGLHYDAVCCAARMLIDYYFELNGGRPIASGTREEWVERIRRDVVARYPRCLYQASPYDRETMMKASAESEEHRRLLKSGMMPLQEWMEEVGAICGKGKKDGSGDLQERNG